MRADVAVGSHEYARITEECPHAADRLGTIVVERVAPVAVNDDGSR